MTYSADKPVFKIFVSSPTESEFARILVEWITNNKDKFPYPITVISKSEYTVNGKSITSKLLDCIYYSNLVVVIDAYTRVKNITLEHASLTCKGCGYTNCNVTVTGESFALNNNVWAEYNYASGIRNKKILYCIDAQIEDQYKAYMNTHASMFAGPAIDTVFIEIDDPAEIENFFDSYILEAYNKWSSYQQTNLTNWTRYIIHHNIIRNKNLDNYGPDKRNSIIWSLNLYNMKIPCNKYPLHITNLYTEIVGYLTHIVNALNQKKRVDKNYIYSFRSRIDNLVSLTNDPKCEPLAASILELLVAIL